MSDGWMNKQVAEKAFRPIGCGLSIELFVLFRAPFFGNHNWAKLKMREETTGAEILDVKMRLSGER